MNLKAPLKLTFHKRYTKMETKNVGKEEKKKLSNDNYKKVVGISDNFDSRSKINS